MLIIDTKHGFDDIVYLVTDPEQKKRIVLSITCFKNSEPRYVLGCGTFTSDHFAGEISETADVLMSTTN
jgi:hypothetical protein